MSTSSLEQLFTREQAATFLQVSTFTVDRLLKSGKLKCIRVGKQVRFKKEDLENPTTSSSNLKES